MAQNVKVPPLDEAPVTVVGSTPQSVFAFDFPFWSPDDLIVYIDGVRMQVSDYTVQGYYVQNGDPVEGGFGSGVVTLNTAVSNCSVTIDRLVVSARESQFSRAAPLGMPSLNSDLNKQTARDQDILRILSRALLVAVGESPIAFSDVIDAARAVAQKADIQYPAVSNPGARSRSIYGKLREQKSILDFIPEAEHEAIFDYTSTYDCAQDWLDAIASFDSPGDLAFPAGRYNIGQTIWNTKPVLCYGDGRGRQHDVDPWVPDAATQIVWKGSVGGIMLEHSPVTGPNARRIGGGGFIGMSLIGDGSLDGTPKAGIGLKVMSVMGGDYDVYVQQTTIAGVLLAVVGTPMAGAGVNDGLLGEARDTQNCNFLVSFKQIGSAAGVGFDTSGDYDANPSLNRIHIVESSYDFSDGIVWRGVDNNDWFIRLTKFGGGGSGVGLRVKGGPDARRTARANRCEYLLPSTGGWVLEGTDTPGVVTACYDNDFFRDVENGTPDPVVGTGATYYERDTIGLQRWTDIGIRRAAAQVLRFFNKAGDRLFQLIGVTGANSHMTAMQGTDLFTLAASSATGTNTALDVLTRGTGKQRFAMDSGAKGLMELDDTLTAGQVALIVRTYDGTITDMRRVTIGATDSGGSGYRLLRVAN